MPRTISYVPHAKTNCHLPQFVLIVALFIAAPNVVSSVTGPALHCAGGGRPARAQSEASGSPASKSELPVIGLEQYRAILAKYRGKPVLVNFWATWCEPCRSEYPMLVKLAHDYQPQGLAVFGVSFDDDADLGVVRHFLAEHRPPFPNFRENREQEGEFIRGISPKWRGAIPSTILYGRDGRPVIQFLGAQTRETLEAEIARLLATPATKSSARPPSSAH